MTVKSGAASSLLLPFYFCLSTYMTFTASTLLQMTEKSRRIIKKRPRQRDVLQIIIRHFLNRASVKTQDRGSRKSHQDRRMRGDDELRVLLNHFLEHREQRQLPLRRKRRFRLIEQI